jgi:HEAT repeat protein
VTVPGLEAKESIGALVLSDLLALERRPSRVVPLLETWLSRFTGAVEAGEHGSANRWMRVLSERSWPDDLRTLVDGVLDRAAATELIEHAAVDLSHGGGDARFGAELMEAWGRRVVPTLVEWIVVDEAPISRKQVVDHLAAIGRADVGALLPYLEDPRWFVVRNFATAIGRSGHEDAVEHLRSCLKHGDDRVRVEALRAIAAIRKDGAVTTIVESLEDPSERVRHAAISLLRAIPSDDVVSVAEQLIDDKRVGSAEARKLVALIAARPAAAAIPALERLAARRPAFGAHKAAREAALFELTSGVS